MTERIQRMKDALKVDKYPICSELPRLFIEGWKAYDGEPMILRRAYGTANFFDKRTLYVDDDELIVGNVASVPNGMEGTLWGASWDDEDLETLCQGNFSITKEVHDELRQLDEYWEARGRQMHVWQGQLYDDERMWPFIRSGVLCPPWQDRLKGRGSGGAGFGWGAGVGPAFFVPEYDKIIGYGIAATLADVKEELRNIRYTSKHEFDKAYYLQAAVVALEAMQRMYHRYGTVCEEKAAVTADETRKKELLTMADSCHWIAEHGARNFRDAIQAFWFYFMQIAHATTPGGRFDQFMYPYYKKDIEDGTLTREEALELIECLRVKINQFQFVAGGKAQRDKTAGLARWHNFIIGGVDREGNDVTNEVSYLLLDAAEDVRLPHFTITIRVNKNTPEKLLKRGMEVVKSGLGMPSFVSEDNYIAGLMEQGCSLEDAREFAMAGCLDLNIPGKSRMLSVGMFITTRVLDIFMHNGVNTATGEQIGPALGEMESFKSYEDFYEAFKKELYYFMGMYAEEHNIQCCVMGALNPDIVHSIFAHDGVRAGQDILSRKMPYENASMLNPVGMINVVNSMAAVRKLVFEDKVITMAQLKAAIDANWEGYEDIHKLCLEAPKYGNDIPEVDEIARDLYQFWCDKTKTFTSIFGEPMRATGISITAHAPGGSYTCATPDGRMKGETLADGVMSPAQGTDKNGPTASLKSALHVNMVSMNAALLNMKISPTSLKTESDMDKLINLVKTYLLNGGKQIQLNVVDNETLKAAKADPKDYQDLIVRVAGYSAYFTKLTKPVQDEVIKRTANEL